VHILGEGGRAKEEILLFISMLRTVVHDVWESRRVCGRCEIPGATWITYRPGPPRPPGPPGGSRWTDGGSTFICIRRTSLSMDNYLFISWCIVDEFMTIVHIGTYCMHCIGHHPYCVCVYIKWLHARIAREVIHNSYRLLVWVQRVHCTVCTYCLL